MDDHHTGRFKKITRFFDLTKGPLFSGPAIAFYGFWFILMGVVCTAVYAPLFHQKKLPSTSVFVIECVMVVVILALGVTMIAKNKYLHAVLMNKTELLEKRQIILFIVCSHLFLIISAISMCATCTLMLALFITVITCCILAWTFLVVSKRPNYSRLDNYCETCGGDCKCNLVSLSSLKLDGDETNFSIGDVQ